MLSRTTALAAALVASGAALTSLIACRRRRQRLQLAHLRVEETADAAHAELILDLVNRAYEVEDGDSGVAFKNPNYPRTYLHEVQSALRDPHCDVLLVRLALDTPCVQAWLEAAEARLTAKQRELLHGVVAVVYYKEHAESHDETSRYAMYGPFAVWPELQGLGLGSLVVRHVEARAVRRGCVRVEVESVNFRTDMLEWYCRRGYKEIGSGEMPIEDARMSRPAYFAILSKQLEQ